MTPNPVVELADVSLVRSGTAVVDRLRWRVEAGQRWAVLGPNGAGKSSLMAIATANERPSRGTAWVLGERLGRVDLRDLRRRVGWVGAALDHRLHPRLSAVEAVATGRHAMLRRWRERYEADDWERADALLSQLGVGHVRDRGLPQLSDGERRRVQIARSLMAAPELLVLDEPTAGLDLGAREDLIDRLDGLAEADGGPAAVLLVVHGVQDIPPSTTHVLLLRDGQAVAAGRVEDVLTAEALSDCFATRLATTRIDGRLVAWRPRAP